MASLEVPSDVSKVTVGGDTIWQNSDGWIPLVLPDGVTGTVLFKDNGDDTALLLGTLGFVRKISSDSYMITNVLLLNPPEGYAFSNHGWSTLGVTPGITCYQARYSDDSSIQFSSGKIEFKNGSLYLSSLQSAFMGSGNQRVMVTFNVNNTSPDASQTGLTYSNPAIVGIEKV